MTFGTRTLTFGTFGTHRGPRAGRAGLMKPAQNRAARVWCIVVLVLVGELAGLALGYRTLLDQDDRTAISKCKNSIGRHLFHVINFSRQEEISDLPIRKTYPTVAHHTPPDFHRTA